MKWLFLFFIALITIGKTYPKDSSCVVLDTAQFIWIKDSLVNQERLDKIAETSKWLEDEMKKPSPPTDYRSGAALVLGGILVISLLVKLIRKDKY